MTNATLKVLEPSTGTNLAAVQVTQDGQPVKISKVVSVDADGADIDFASGADIQAVTNSLGSDGASPPTISGAGVRGWLRAIYEKLSGSIAVTGAVSVSNTPSEYPLPSSQITSLTPQTNGLTDAQLRASSVPISGSVSVSNFPGAQTISGSVSVTNHPGEYPLPSSQVASLTPQTDGLTNAQLRASSIPVSGSVSVSNFPATQPISGSVVVTNTPSEYPLPLAQVASLTPQTNALTDTQLRASPVAVSGGLTDAELRASALEVTGSVSVSNFPATQAVSAVSLPLPSGAATEATLASLLAAQASGATYRLFIPSQAVGANKVFCDIFNAPGSGVKLLVKSAKAHIDTDTAVTGVVGVEVALTRTSAIGTAGTAAVLNNAVLTAPSITAFDPATTLSASITARSAPTGGAAAGANFGSRWLSTEETSAGGQVIGANGAEFVNGGTSKIIVPAGTGMRFVQGAVASVGNLAFEITFEAVSE